jgi:hypothetical protein
MRHAGWMGLAVVLMVGSLAWAGPGGGTRIEGTITAIDAEALQIMVDGMTVQVTPDTLIKRGAQTIAFTDLAVDMTVAACGILDDSGVLVASRINVKFCQAAAPQVPAVGVGSVSLPAVKAAGAGAVGVAGVVPLSPAEIEGLLSMREEEKLARDVYLTLSAQWPVAVFANIAQSEQTHMDSIRTLLVRYGLADPVAGMGVGQFASPHFQALYDELVASGGESLIAALTVGATIEEIDIVDLFDNLADATHQDIRRVYQNLEKGSENHLRAFVGQLASRGVVYEPQYLDPELYQQIIGG